MYKCIPLAYFVFFLVSMTNSAYAQNHIAIRPFSTQRTVCGLVFSENDKFQLMLSKLMKVHCEIVLIMNDTMLVLIT